MPPHWASLAALAIAYAATFAVLALWRGRLSRTGGRDPLSRELLRSPGESRRARMSLAWIDAAEYAALGVLLAAASAQLLADPAALALAVGVALAWALGRLWRVLGRARRLALDYEAEVAAGQELDTLRNFGFRVYHDVPVRELGGATVDHVLVGPSGVFAVATEGRPAPRANGSLGEVTYDGESLRFARRRETRPIVRAKERASEVSLWLSTVIGEPVPVEPVLVLPGWSVRRTAISGIPVLAARRIRHFFGRPMEPRLSDALVERVARQLDERCRTA